MITTAQITCPHCSRDFEIGMSPYETLSKLPCTLCNQTIVRKDTDHCVVCSYGNVICLAQQSRRDCCSG